jgi:hypothetical protein
MWLTSSARYSGSLNHSATPGIIFPVHVVSRALLVGLLVELPPKPLAPFGVHAGAGIAGGVPIVFPRELGEHPLQTVFLLIPGEDSDAAPLGA